MVVVVAAVGGGIIGREGGEARDRWAVVGISSNGCDSALLVRCAPGKGEGTLMRGGAFCLRNVRPSMSMRVEARLAKEDDLDERDSW